jgi:hypothetical protein
LQRHEVERAGRERHPQDVPDQPLDSGTSQLARLACPADRNLGDVDGSDCPAAPSEPDRVRALATTDVKRSAGAEAGDFGDEPPVRLPAPQPGLSLAVPRVPLGDLLRRPKPLLAVLVVFPW